MADVKEKEEVPTNAAGASVAKVDMKFEAVVVSVSDVNRAKEFYQKLGWRLDADFGFDNGFRVVQFTPPGSACSVQFGTKMTSVVPGSTQGLYLIVTDVKAAHDELVARGVKVKRRVPRWNASAQFQPDGASGRVSGPDPEHRSCFSFATFRDPDGNTWLLREITTRPPGRVTGDTTYRSVGKPVSALRRAEAAHGEHERRTGQRDENWPDWYAAYLVAEQSGAELPK